MKVACTPHIASTFRPIANGLTQSAKFLWAHRAKIAAAAGAVSTFIIGWKGGPTDAIFAGFMSAGLWCASAYAKDIGKSIYYTAAGVAMGLMVSMFYTSLVGDPSAQLKEAKQEAIDTVLYEGVNIKTIPFEMIDRAHHWGKKISTEVTAIAFCRKPGVTIITSESYQSLKVYEQGFSNGYKWFPSERAHSWRMAGEAQLSDLVGCKQAYKPEEPTL